MQSCVSSEGQEKLRDGSVQVWNMMTIKTKSFPLHFTDRHNWKNRRWEIYICCGIAATRGSCWRSNPNWWTRYCSTRSPWP